MDKIEDFLAFVKSQSEFHARQAARFKHDERRFRLHSGTAATFDELYSYLDKVKNSGSKSAVSGHSLSLGWGELEDLPSELVEELSITDSDKLDFSIVQLIEKRGGAATLDRILVDLYNLTGEILKRQNLNARLYRMAQKEMVFSVPTKKGVYSSFPITEEEAAKLV